MYYLILFADSFKTKPMIPARFDDLEVERVDGWVRFRTLWMRYEEVHLPTLCIIRNAYHVPTYLTSVWTWQWLPRKIIAKWRRLSKCSHNCGCNMQCSNAQKCSTNLKNVVCFVLIFQKAMLLVTSSAPCACAHPAQLHELHDVLPLRSFKSTCTALEAPHRATWTQY